MAFKAFPTRQTGENWVFWVTQHVFITTMTFMNHFWNVVFRATDPLVEGFGFPLPLQNHGHNSLFLTHRHNPIHLQMLHLMEHSWGQ